MHALILHLTLGMGSDALAAELTLASLKAKNEEERRMIWKQYDDFAERAVPSLHMMTQACGTRSYRVVHCADEGLVSQFLYLTFKHPRLGAQIGFLWNLISGYAKDKYSLARIGFMPRPDQYAAYASNWLWGSQACSIVSSPWIARTDVTLFSERRLCFHRQQNH